MGKAISDPKILGKNFNPNRPTYYNLSIEKTGFVKETIFQIRPSYFEKLASQFAPSGSIAETALTIPLKPPIPKVTKIPLLPPPPEKADMKILREREVKMEDIKSAVKNAEVIITPPTKEPFIYPEEPPADITIKTEQEAKKTVAEIPENLEPLSPTGKPAVIPKELEPLAQEARKYKSAEEFASNQIEKKYNISIRDRGDLNKLVRDEVFNTNALQEELSLLEAKKTKQAFKEGVISKIGSIINEGKKTERIIPFYEKEKKVLDKYIQDDPEWQTLNRLTSTPRKTDLNEVQYEFSKLTDFYNQAIKQPAPKPLAPIEAKEKKLPQEQIKSKEPEKLIFPLEKKISPKKPLLTAEILKTFLPKKNYLPILSQVLVKNGFALTTDLESSVQIKTDLPDGLYQIIGKNLEKRNFDTLGIDDFPVLPKPSGKEVVRISSQEIENIIKKAVTIIPKDNTRPEITGVYIQIKGNKMTIAATDSFQLYQKTLQAEGVNDGDFILSSPEKISKTLSALGERTSIKYNAKENIAFLSGENGNITIKTVDGTFPKYEEIYPSYSEQFVFDKTELLSAFKEIDIHSKQIMKQELEENEHGLHKLSPSLIRESVNSKNRALIFEDKLTLQSEGKKIDIAAKRQVVKSRAGSAIDGVLIMPIRGDEKLSVELNSNYLQNAIKILDGDKVYLSIDGSNNTRPVHLSNKNEFEGLYEGKGGFVGGSKGVFVEEFPEELGGIDAIRPLEFPELVDLAHEISGKFPESKKLRTRKGFQQGLRLVIERGLFEKGKEKQLAQLLAHELGHLTDYIPEFTTSRGNLLGRILSLRKFLKNTFGDKEITNKVLRDELLKVSEWWRPYDKKKSSKQFINYRNSSVELYADALSVLFNTPGTLERMAPNFYREFFENLDKKPKFHKTYFYF